MKQLIITTSGKKKIYGQFEGRLSEPLVVFIPGMPGNIDESPYPEASDFFVKKGYATFRWNLYGWQKYARQLMECSLTTHAQDLDKVIAHFRKKGVKEIHVIGHSLGGPVAFLSEAQDFESAVLWDPSYNLSFLHGAAAMRKPKYCAQHKTYILQYGTNIVLSKKMVDEVEKFPWKNVSKTFTPPFKVLIAGNGVLHSAKNYTRNTDAKSAFEILPDTDHGFLTRAEQRKVFTATHRWFKNRK